MMVYVCSYKDNKNIKQVLIVLLVKKEKNLIFHFCAWDLFAHSKNWYSQFCFAFEGFKMYSNSLSAAITSYSLVTFTENSYAVCSLSVRTSSFLAGHSCE